MSNVFSFTGSIGRDGEVRYMPNGNAVLNVAVANNIGFGDKQQTMWIQVAIFGKKAESTLVDYLKKGQQVFVSGQLSQEEYTANDGTQKTSLRLNCNVIDLVGSKNQQGQNNSPDANNQPAQQNNQQPVQNNNQQRGKSQGYGNSGEQQNNQRQQGGNQQNNQNNNEYFDDSIPF